ncbi:MAG: anhydro-N-acetylmuramic acid kinase, partial [Hyphomicrobiaceae bacterium]|nr:anhydro-N-acetylmuramic acid kinase [Hyphomicrobiaceae bacterium]
QHNAGAYDDAGHVAAQGVVATDVVARLMQDPYFSMQAPKSLDRNYFHVLAQAVDGMSLADGAATLTAFTVQATVSALRLVPNVPRRWIVAGGGRLNLTLMSGLAAALGGPVEPVEVVGWDGDQLEAECFAFLAVRSLAGLPLSLPTTTAVPRPMAGGLLFRA